MPNIVSSNFFRSDLSEAEQKGFLSAFSIASSILKEDIVRPILYCYHHRHQSYNLFWFISSQSTSFKPIILLNEFAVAGPKPA